MSFYYPAFYKCKDKPKTFPKHSELYVILSIDIYTLKDNRVGN